MRASGYQLVNYWYIITIDTSDIDAYMLNHKMIVYNEKYIYND